MRDDVLTPAHLAKAMTDMLFAIPKPSRVFIHPSERDLYGLPIVVSEWAPPGGLIITSAGGSTAVLNTSDMASIRRRDDGAWSRDWWRGGTERGWWE